MYTFYPSRVPVFNSTEYNNQNLTETAYKDGGLGRSAVEQGGYQIAALALTLGMAVVSGSITGLIMRLSIFSPIEEPDALFEDEGGWLMPLEHAEESHGKKISLEIYEEPTNKSQLKTTGSEKKIEI